METISIALICSIVGAVIGVATFSKNRTKDLKADTKEEAETRTKLDYISRGVDDIRIDIKAQQREMQEMKEQIIRVEESCKSAHKRIDGIEGEK